MPDTLADHGNNTRSVWDDQFYDDAQGDSMSEVTIRIRDNGPLLIEGPFKLLDGEGNPLPLDPDRPAFALCRCGASANKPFCDGAHKNCDFNSVARASDP